MFEICIFGGTTEGRRLAEFLRGQGGRVTVCVATEYGEALIPESDDVRVLAGRMDAAGMAALLEQRRFDAVVDATHPFATEASRNILAACEAAHMEYVRLCRGGTEPDGDAVVVDSVEAAADFLAAHAGNALIATGGKALAPYARVPEYQGRLWARVLPMAASLSACEEAGFPPSHVIAMQGPFSVEMNAATLRQIRAEWLVTKDSGDIGGLREKLEAARLAGARCVVVGRPEAGDGEDFAGVVARLIERFGLRDARQIAVVSMGMGAPETLTLEAKAALEACDCVIGAARLLVTAKGFGKPCHDAIAPEQIARIIREHPEYRRVVVAMSGDTGFFSGAKKLLPLLAGHDVRLLPGLSSLQALCAKLGTTWDDVQPVSLHGREGGVVQALGRTGRVFALLGGADGLKRLCGTLCEAGLGDARLCVGQRLSYPDEAILTGTAEALSDAACEPLSVALIEHAPRPLPVGLPDGAFLRETCGRIVPMTKSEVRAVAVSKLRLTEDAVVWDVGAGTGSVSVEAALLCTRGRVFAVECREDAAALIGRNARRFGLKNLEIVRGEAPGALADLPVPDRVFIGGSGGSLRGIIDAALAKNPGARIVVNAIAPESVGEIAAILGEGRFASRELIQLSVSRAKPKGRVHLMEAANPVWIAAMGNDEGGEGR